MASSRKVSPIIRSQYTYYRQQPTWDRSNQATRKVRLVGLALSGLVIVSMSSIVTASSLARARSIFGGRLDMLSANRANTSLSTVAFIPTLGGRPKSSSVCEFSHTQLLVSASTRPRHSSNSVLHSDKLQPGTDTQKDQSAPAEINEHNWQSSALTEVISLPSISVPSHHVHKLLSDKNSPIKQYLATKMEEFDGIHPRVKVVVDFDSQDNTNDENKPRKRILLMSSPAADLNSNDTCHTTNKLEDSFIELRNLLPYLPQNNIQQLITIYNALPSKPETINIPYQNQSVSRILSKLLPASAQPPPSSYEQIGHVAHFNLRSNHLPYGNLIGSVLLDRIDSIKTVVNKLGEVGGPYRTYKVDLLAGDNNYNVHLVEHGASLYFDLTKVYWCTRLEGERTHMIQHDFQPNQVIADAFCGVGALCTRAALAKGCRILANDLNPDAVTFCRDSAKRNGIDVSDPKVFNVQCGDAREFIMGLGESASSLPHHLVLNFPLDSPSFLNALRWWPSGEKVLHPPQVHVYTFARGDEDRTAAETAIDMVADGLLPEGGYTEPSRFRGQYLNSLGCNVKAREIRDAAPGKLVICVSFSVTRVLLRRMQGDYGLI